MVAEKNLETSTDRAIYRLTVYGYDSGMNELLSGVHFDYRTKRVHNPVKKKNDDLCIRAIRSASSLKGVKLNKPIVVHYKFYCRDKKRDRTNISSAFDKSFLDALQKCQILKNDGFDNVINITCDFAIDKLRPRVEVLIEEIDSTSYELYDWSSYDTERTDN